MAGLLAHRQPSLPLEGFMRNQTRHRHACDGGWITPVPLPSTARPTDGLSSSRIIHQQSSLPRRFFLVNGV